MSSSPSIAVKSATTDAGDIAHVVISFDSLPQIGGAHSWLHEVYSRWSTPVSFLTAAISHDAEEAARQRAFDALDHGSLQYVREVDVPGEINLLKPACWGKFLRAGESVSRLRQGRRVVLHSLRAFPEGFAGLLYKARHPGTSVLITYAHGEEILIAQTSGQLKLMARCTYRASDLVIANSENTAAMVRTLVPGARVVRISPGVDAGAFERPAEEVAAYRESLGWPSGTVVLATVARMEPRKNHEAVIRAVHALRPEGVPVAYVCGGEGPERRRLMALADELGVGPWVRFTGAVSESEKKLIFASCDIHVMPSIQLGEMIEGFGIVFLEAAAAGKPSICGNVGGQPEAVVNGRTGLVIDGGSPTALSEAIRTLALDEARRFAMGDAGRLWAREHDWQRVAQATENALAEVLTRRKWPAAGRSARVRQPAH
jgi:phosphatidylinositol alpha-1,6-mannosyltransferase